MEQLSSRAIFFDHCRAMLFVVFLAEAPLFVLTQSKAKQSQTCAPAEDPPLQSNLGPYSFRRSNRRGVDNA